MAKGKTKKLEKTLEAESATLLKHLLEMELRRLKSDADIDILMFNGIDGRIFASSIPPVLSDKQYYLLNMVKTNLHYICGQLKHENLNVSVQQYDEGNLIISTVGKSAFLISLLTKKSDIKEAMDVIEPILNASIVLKHILELKPITDEIIAEYPKEVAEELKKLSRLLFVERFETTREYKKNMEILKLVKKRIGEAVGIGNVDEIVTLTMNEVGRTAPYMTDDLWVTFLEGVINNHVRRLRGDIIADECYKSWIPEIQQKLKSFV